MRFPFLMLAGVILLHGCGRDAARIPLHGDVLVDGQRISGMISFRPASGTDGGIVSTKLTDGEYQFDERSGPLPGDYNAVIEQLVTGQKGATAAPVEPRQWTFLRTLNVGENQLNFIIDDDVEADKTSESGAAG